MPREKQRRSRGIDACIDKMWEDRNDTASRFWRWAISRIVETKPKTRPTAYWKKEA
jgi:hypothetical protein